MIHQFKYEHQIHLRAALAWLLEKALEEPRIAAEKGWILTPVPLHRRRQREREFNQAEELARLVSASRGLPLVRGLRRVRYTSTQARLDRAERLGNLKNAFALSALARWRGAYSGAKVLLVDDVFTTGATAHECARVLKQQGGAQRVVVVTVARG
jgi:ComF family protein